MVWTRLSSHASTEKNQPTAVLLVLSVGCGSPTKLVCYQSLTPSDCNTSGYPFMGLPLHQPSSSCRFGPLGFSVGTGGVGILPDGQLVLLALVDLPRIRWLPMGSPQLVPQHFSTTDVGLRCHHHIPLAPAVCSCLGQVPRKKRHHLRILAEETSLEATMKKYMIYFPRGLANTSRNEWNIYDWKPDLYT